jgi:hypothetical protein
MIIQPQLSASHHHMMASVVTALPRDPIGTADDHAAQQSAAVALVCTLGPADAVQHMFAARTATAHFAAMECFRFAAQPEQGQAMAMRWMNLARTMARLSTDGIDRLERQQRLGPVEPPASADAGWAAEDAKSEPTNPMPSEERAAVSERQPPTPATQPAAATHPAMAAEPDHPAIENPIDPNNPTPSEEPASVAQTAPPPDTDTAATPEPAAIIEGTACRPAHPADPQPDSITETWAVAGTAQPSSNGMALDNHLQSLSDEEMLAFADRMLAQAAIGRAEASKAAA